MSMMETLLRKQGPVRLNKEPKLRRALDPAVVTFSHRDYNLIMNDTTPPPFSDRGSSVWWNERYRQQDVPWDTGVVPPELHELIDNGLLRPPGVALDLGCGTGTNVALLARLGFAAVGVDFALRALVTARQKALQTGLSALFCLGDVADLSFLDVQAQFALDMGCLHSLSPENRTRYAQSLAQRMTSGGLYLLYGFDFDAAAQGGPSGFDADEIQTRFSPGFELCWKRPSTQGTCPVAWYLLERR